MREMSHEDTQKSMPRKSPRCKEEAVHRMLAAEVKVDRLGGTRSFMPLRDPIAWYAFLCQEFYFVIDVLRSIEMTWKIKNSSHYNQWKACQPPWAVSKTILCK